MDSQLTAVIIGAGAGIAGQLLTQLCGYLTTFIDRKHERHAYFRSRLEEMSEAVTVTVDWTQSFTKANSLEAIIDSKPPAECRRLMTIASLYFPELMDPVREYCNCLIEHHNWSISFFNASAPAPLGAQIQMAILNSSKPEELKEMQMRPLYLRQSLDDAITKEAKKHRP